MVGETPYDFLLRSKYDLYQSLLDGADLENAAANYEFAKMNAQRHGIFRKHHAHHTFDYASHLLLKAKKWSHGKFRKLTSEQTGLSNEAWIDRLSRFTNGHNNPRESHTSWPSIVNSDASIAYGSISPWDISPLMHNSEWDKPQWLQTLLQSWLPYQTEDGNISNYHHGVLEPGVKEHERHQKMSWHNSATHMGRLEGQGFHAPSELYEKHFNEWLAQAPKAIQDASPIKQREAHLSQYQKVWAGEEPDPLGEDDGDHSLGFLGYALGLEWLKPHQRDDVIQHLSNHGFSRKDIDGNSVETNTPHIPHGWLTRNWKGRFASGEGIHRLRGMDAAASGIPSPYYLPGDESEKENFMRRRYMEALKEVMVYQADNPTIGVKRGQPAFGYFNDDGIWIHDEHHEDAHPLLDLRAHHDTGIDPRRVGMNQQKKAGVHSLYDMLINDPVHKGKLPRHVHKYDEDGNIVESNIQSHGHNVKDDNFQSVQEFEDYLGPILDENQHALAKARGQDMFEEFERRKQVMNALGPYVNMYHFMGGDTNDVRMSPYALFMSQHHASGGYAADQLNPLSELHHMFHPDDWGNPDGHGLFTQADKESGLQTIPVGDWEEPWKQSPKIWPSKVGSELGEDQYEMREDLEQISAPIVGEPRDAMHSLMGMFAFQPGETYDYGGNANLLAGNTRHWAQLASSWEPDYHDVFGRERPGGPLRLQGKSLYQDKEDSEQTSIIDPHDYTIRQTLSHILSTGGRGRADEKRRGLLNALFLRFNEHPAEATSGKKIPGLTGTGNLRPSSDRLDGWIKDLNAYARENGLHLIPGDPSNTDPISRVLQFILEADLGREEEHPQPLPLFAPASETYSAGSPDATIPPSSVGLGPGESGKSSEQTGWLTQDPHKWHLYNANRGPGHARPGFHPEKVNWGGKTGEQVLPAPGLAFDFRQDALDALQSGETECPVCHGDGRVDPEDLKKADTPNLLNLPSKPNLLDLGKEPTKKPKALECPNCGGSGKHKLSEEAKQSIVGPLPHIHREQQLIGQLEDWLLAPEEERKPEEWYEGKEKELSLLSKPQPYEEGFLSAQRGYTTSKLLSTQRLVRNAAGSLAEKVRKQFKDDKLPDPFGPDENGDWSQAHVNALALWAHANELVLRAHPQHRDWDDDHIHGIDASDETLDNYNEKPQAYDDMPTGASIFLPQGTEGKHQTHMKSLPMSVYNSQGYRMRYGWKMAPTFGVGFDLMDGEPSILHNNGEPANERKPYLNVPMDELQQVFPDMQPMSHTHISAPSAEDRPENQKMTDTGESAAFQLSEDNPTVSNLLKALTNPDLLKDDVRIKPIKPAHRIFSLSDLTNLRGFSGDWVVSTWTKGKRAIVHKKGKKVSAVYADGSNCKLSKDMRHGLVNANDDSFCLDVMVSKDGITVMDLLSHGHRDLYEEPLKDRLARLRSQFESTDAVLMPAPFNTRRTDDDGLEQAVSNLEDEEHDGILLRDAISTYMKGEPRHPKWVLFRKENELDVIILDRRGRGPYMYRLGIGPINPQKAKSLENRAVEYEGKWFMDIGTLLRERKPFNEGDYVQISISSVSHKQRNDEDVYDVQPIKILGESTTEATDSVDTLNTLTKSYAPIIYPHDVVVNTNNIQIHMHAIQDTIVYKMDKWDNGWALHAPTSILNDLSNSDYAIHMAESVRPYWEPVVGMTLKGLIKVDYNPRDTEDKGRDEDEVEEDGSHEVGFKLKKPKKQDDEQILKPHADFKKTLVEALTVIDDVLKEKATWTGARGLGIGLGTPDSAPRGPTEITSDENTLDYDMREREEDKEEKPKKKPAKMTGEPRPLTESVETDEGEIGEIRVTAQEATLEMEPPGPTV